MQWKRLEKQNIMNGLEIHFLKVSDIAMANKITIQADNTKEENEIKQEIEQLNKKFDISIESGASDEELDEIENKIDLLCDKLNVLRFPG